MYNAAGNISKVYRTVPEFSDLPDEVLLKILSFLTPLLQDLSSISSVNSTFYRLCKDITLWKILKFPPTNCSDLSMAHNRFTNIITMYSSSTTIDISGCWDKVTDSYLKIIGTNCHEASVLNCNRCYQITDFGLKFIADGCKNLRALSINACCEITCQAVSYVAQQCTKLEALNMSDCVGLWRDPHKMRTIPTHCSRLKHFNASGSQRSRGIVVDLDMKQFATHCHDLRHLNIRSSQITDNGLRYIAQYCKSLEYLNVGHCNVTDHGLKNPFNHLKSVDLTGCWHVTDNGIKSLVTNNPHLESIVLCWCFRVSDFAIGCIAEVCRSLRDLNISHCFTVTNKGIMQIVHKCRLLRSLNLKGVFLVSDDTVRHLAEQCTLTLKEVDLDGCTRVTSAAVQFVANTCPNLASICHDVSISCGPSQSKRNANEAKNLLTI